jgi:hypothetical protein
MKMKIKARIRWKMYNSVKKRIERRIRPWGWEPFQVVTFVSKPIKFWLSGKRARYSNPLPFKPKSSIRFVNINRIKLGATPISPVFRLKYYTDIRL